MFCSKCSLKKCLQGFVFVYRCVLYVVFGINGWYCVVKFIEEKSLFLRHDFICNICLLFTEEFSGGSKGGGVGCPDHP